MTPDSLCFALILICICFLSSSHSQAYSPSSPAFSPTSPVSLAVNLRVAKRALSVLCVGFLACLMYHFARNVPVHRMNLLTLFQTYPTGVHAHKPAILSYIASLHTIGHRLSCWRTGRGVLAIFPCVQSNSGNGRRG